LVVKKNYFAHCIKLFGSQAARIMKNVNKYLYVIHVTQLLWLTAQATHTVGWLMVNDTSTRNALQYVTQIFYAWQ